MLTRVVETDLIILGYAILLDKFLQRFQGRSNGSKGAEAKDIRLHCGRHLELFQRGPRFQLLKKKNIIFCAPKSYKWKCSHILNIN